MPYPKCPKCGDRRSHSHCKGCGVADPKGPRGKTIADWEAKTGWKYLESRSDWLACPSCQRNPETVARIKSGEKFPLTEGKA